MGRRAIEAALLTVLAISTIIEAYPVFNGKKYGQRPWAPYPIIYQPRTTKPYAPYYDSYLPDALNPVDLYYSPDPYEKYRMYQVPQYYYPDQYYYNEESEVPEEEDVAPYGTVPDDWYDSPNADINTLFLRNLVMAQIYKDAVAKNQRYSSLYTRPNNEDYDEDGEPYVFGAPVREMLPTPPSKEDKDVKDLKSLVSDSAKQRREPTRRKIVEVPMRSLDENRWVDKRSNFDLTTETNVPQESTAEDEIAMPARASAFNQRSYQPSAYDAIKKLLIQQNSIEGGRQPQKRSYVLNEESLVEQLGKLKKSI